MDRGHPQLAARLDALHPAVLKLIALTTAAADLHGRPVGVCGSLASDPRAAPLLIGLGVRELSALPAVLPQLKAVLSQVRLEDCRRLAARALEAPSAQAVRMLLAESAPTGAA